MGKGHVRVKPLQNFKCFYLLFIYYSKFIKTSLNQFFATFYVTCSKINILRKCEIVVDPEKPLVNPKTEAEWFNLFSRRPTYELGGGLMLVKNFNVVVKERKN